jgi:hypothetical protein
VVELGPVATKQRPGVATFLTRLVWNLLGAASKRWAVFEHWVSDDDEDHLESYPVGHDSTPLSRPHSLDSNCKAMLDPVGRPENTTLQLPEER